MIDPAAEHYKPDSLPAFQPLMLMQTANDPPGQITRHLEQRMVTVAVILNSNQVALVVLTRSVAKSRTKLALGVG
jgi:hypothetical protein